MLLVETFVGPSKIEGVGVFVMAPVLKGAKIWTLDAVFDRKIPEANLAELSREMQNFVERYSYRNPEFPGQLILETDNGRFMNHSTSPNVCFSDQYSGFAARDIEAGGELTCDYNELEPGFKLLPSLMEMTLRKQANGRRVQRVTRHGANGQILLAKG